MNSHNKCKAQAGTLGMCHDGKEFSLTLTRVAKILKVGGAKLNLVLMEQMNDEKNHDYGSIAINPKNS